MRITLNQLQPNRYDYEDVYLTDPLTLVVPEWNKWWKRWLREWAVKILRKLGATTKMERREYYKSIDIQYDEIDNLNWKDVTPRMGATYDLFGNGKTALKVTLNKYLEGLGTTGFGAAQVSDAPNPILRLLNQTQRTWNDADRDFIPDCDLNNFSANGECLTLDNAATFGTITPGTSYDPDLLVGWGRRSFNWELTASVQHEIVPPSRPGIR